MEVLKRLDLYPKAAEEYRVRTVTGAVVSIACTFLVLILAMSEFSAYLTVQVAPELTVDTSFGEMLRIDLDITFLAMPCVNLVIDAMDISGKSKD